MSYKDRLKKMSKKMEGYQEGYTPGGFVPLPDGEYNFRVKAIIDEWKPNAEKGLPARLYIGFQFIVDEGEQQGKTVYNNCGIEDKTGAQICRGIIEDLGYDWPGDDLSVIEDVITDITERSPLVTGITKSKVNDAGYTNTKVRLTEVHELAGAVESVESEVEEESEAFVNSDKQDLLDFAASQGIDGFTDEHELSDMVEALKEAGLDPIPTGSLTNEEKSLLDRLGLLEALVEKVAKVMIPAKKAITKPVLKTKKGKK